MTAEDFWEVGASRRRYSRADVLDSLEERHREPRVDPRRTSDFLCRKIGSEVYLLTYVLAQGDRVTRRCTLWQRVSGQWKALYHQGTIVSAAH